MIKWLTAGNCDKDSLTSLHKLNELKVAGMEVEFVRQVFMNNEMAKKVGKEAKKLGLILTIHASYYINLSSEEKEKVVASKKRILQACERGHHLNAKSVTFHAGYYGKRSKEETFDLIKKQIMDLLKTIKAKKWDVKLSPETTGKGSQFGSLDELIKLKKETGCGICVDFAHLLARDGKRDYDEIFGKLKKARINNIHCHFSGIEYTAKGERKHLLTPVKDIKELIKALKKYKISGYIVNESPDPLGDTLKSMKLYGKG